MFVCISNGVSLYLVYQTDIIMNTNCDSVGGMSGWSVHTPGWRKTDSFRTPSQLIVVRSTVTTWHFPLSLSFTWQNSLERLFQRIWENVVTNLIQNLFVVVLYLSQKSFPTKKLSVEKIHDLDKTKYVHISVFLPTGNGRIRGLSFFLFIINLCPQFGPSSLDPVKSTGSTYHSTQDFSLTGCLLLNDKAAVFLAGMDHGS